MAASFFGPIDLLKWIAKLLKNRKAVPFVYNFYVLKNEISQEYLRKWLKANTKKWVYQQNKNFKSNDIYWIGRFSLKEKARINTVKTSFNKTSALIESCSREDLKAAFYTLDAANKIGGPWKDSDVTSKLHSAQYGGEMKWNPWQSSILSKIEAKSITGLINIVVSNNKSTEISFLSRYCSHYEIANRIVPSPDIDDLVEEVSNLPYSRVYIFNSYTESSKDELLQFFNSLNNIKNGKAYNDPDSNILSLYKDPEVWVFMDSLQTINLSSLPPNFIIYTINDSLELERLTSHLKPIKTPKPII